MKTPEQILEREERLLKSLKEGLRLGDGLLDDKEYINNQVVSYVIAEGVAPRLDPNTKGRFRFVVETNLFGGSKHIDADKYLSLTM